MFKFRVSLVLGLVLISFLSTTVYGDRRIRDKPSRRCRDQIAEATHKRNLPSLTVPRMPRLDYLRDGGAFLFQFARQEWITGLRGQNLEPVLQSLISNGLPESKKDRPIHIKNVRKIGSRLASAYVILDNTHRAPAVLRRFLQGFGRLNDLVGFGKAEDDTDIKAQAQGFLDMLPDPSVCEDLPALIQADGESIRNYLLTSIGVIRLLLKPEKLKIRHFHDARKRLRIFRDVFVLLTDPFQHPANIMMLALRYAARLNTNLGGMNDALFRDFLRQWRNRQEGMFQSENIFEAREQFERQVKVAIPHRLKDRIGLFLDSFEEAVRKSFP